MDEVLIPKERVLVSLNDLMADVAPLVEAAHGGDRVAMGKLKLYLDERPWIWEEFRRTFSRTSEELWLKLTSGGSLLVREGLKQTLDAMRSELAGDNSSALERMLVDRICLCWLQLQQAEVENVECSTGNVRIPVARYYQERVDRAQHRWLAAVKSLAQVRRLAIPKIGQLNIGNQQVNVAEIPAARASISSSSVPGGQAAVNSTVGEHSPLQATC